MNRFKLHEFLFATNTHEMDMHSRDKFRLNYKSMMRTRITERFPKFRFA